MCEFVFGGESEKKNTYKKNHFHKRKDKSIITITSYKVLSFLYILFELVQKS